MYVDKSSKMTLANVHHCVNGEEEEEDWDQCVHSLVLPLLLGCLIVFLSVWMIEVSNEAAMAAGQLKTLGYSVALSRLTVQDRNILVRFEMNKTDAGESHSRVFYIYI